MLKCSVSTHVFRLHDDQRIQVNGYVHRPAVPTLLPCSPRPQTPDPVVETKEPLVTPGREGVARQADGDGQRRRVEGRRTRGRRRYHLVLGKECGERLVAPPEQDVAGDGRRRVDGVAADEASGAVAFQPGLRRHRGRKGETFSDIFIFFSRRLRRHIE